MLLDNVPVVRCKPTTPDLGLGLCGCVVTCPHLPTGGAEPVTECGVFLLSAPRGNVNAESPSNRQVSMSMVQTW